MIGGQAVYAIDLNYDGISLSDFGFIVCDFDHSDGATIAEAGSTIEFNKISYNNGKKWSLVNAKYNDCIQTTFDICKDPDYSENGDLSISDDEYRDIARWLNRKEFCKLFFIYDDPDNRDFRYYNASFNLQKIKIAETLCGIRLTMETDKPFGYGQEKKHVLDVVNTSATYEIKDMSDEIGILYPSVTIQCVESGNLTITNKDDINGSSFICNTVIKNCSAGEIITFNGETGIIESSLISHDIANDFNYDFFKLSNSYKNRNNYLSFSIKCVFNLTYSPVVKDIPNI